MTNPQPLPPVADGQVHAPLNKDRTPPYKIAGVVMAIVTAVVLSLTWASREGRAAQSSRKGTGDWSSPGLASPADTSAPE